MRLHAIDRPFALLDLRDLLLSWQHRVSLRAAALRARWKRWDRPQDMVWLMIVGLLVLLWIWVLWTAPIARRH